MKNLIRKILTEIEVPHLYQPTGNSCGPSCLKMIHDYFVGDRFKISDICRACGTDWVVGTPPDRMVKGLKYMGIQYVEHMMEEDPYQSLKDSIDKGHPCIVRANVHGTPHWIIVVDYDNDTLMVNDPWLGRLIYDIDEFDEIWFSGRDKVREYFYYEILGGDKSVFPSEEQSPWEEDEEIENYDDEEDYMEDEPEMWSQEWIENILEMARQATGNETLSMSDLADFDEETGHQDWSSGEALLNAFVEWFGGEMGGSEDEEEYEEEVNDERYGTQLSLEFPYSDELEISNFTSEKEILDALKIGLKVFEGQMGQKELLNYLAKAADWEISVKATYQGKIVGFYLLSENQMGDYIHHYMVRDYNCYSMQQCNKKHPGSIKVDPLKFKNLDGVEGVALGIDPEYKGLGIGKALMEYSQSLPYDYVWGQQYEHLGNIQHWIKRREVAAYFPGLYLTYQML